ncbi:MAG: hypothetical protein P1V97_04680 [Planctomycetota bacterium]|nr:hypothetical protein [Planctomycetota bacterium]
MTEYCSADELVLKNGGRIKGIIVKENAKEVVIKIGGGEMRLARKKIKEIIRDKKSDNKKLKEKQREDLQGGEKASPKKKAEFRSPKDLFEQMKAIELTPKARLTHFAKFIVRSERKVYALSLVLKAYALAAERGAEAEAALKKIAARYKLKDPAKQGKLPPIQNLSDSKKRADLMIRTTNYLALIAALDRFFQTFNKDAYFAMQVVTEVVKIDVKEKRGVVTLKDGRKVPITILSDGWYLSMRNVP